MATRQTDPPKQPSPLLVYGASLAAASAGQESKQRAADAAAQAAQEGGKLAGRALKDFILAGFIAYAGFAKAMLRQAAPEMAKGTSASIDDIEQVISDEEAMEDEFQRRARLRMERDLPDVLAISDPAQRATALSKLMSREERYARQRSRAMATRAAAAIDRVVLKAESPQGAYWKLDPTVREHTVGCLILGEKFWPWEVLDRVHPPRHHGCPCRLMGMGEAQLAGLSFTIPDTQSAIQRASGIVMEAEIEDDVADEIAELSAIQQELHKRGMLDPDISLVEGFGHIPGHGFNPFQFERQHPRGLGGRWIDKPGTGGPALSPGKAVTEPVKATKRATKTAKTAATHAPKGATSKGAIRVGADVEKAAQLLAEGKEVILSQPSAVSTLLDKLAEQVQEAKAKGEKAPNINLCKVTVEGQDIFCVKNKGIPRIKMPQLGGKPRPGSDAAKLTRGEDGMVDGGEAFVNWLRDKGYEVSAEDVPAANLRATQNELVGSKVASIAKRMEQDDSFGNGSIFVSGDDYVLDGHHRWAARVGNDARDGNLGDLRQPVERVHADIVTLLHEARTFAEEFGIETKDATDPAPPKPTAERIVKTSKDGGEKRRIGITPARGHHKDLKAYYDSSRFKNFESYGKERADALGIKVHGIERSDGYWQGDREPSTIWDMEDGEAIDRWTGEMVRRYNQDAGMNFHEDPKGPHRLIRADFNGATKDEVLTAIEDAGIDGATVFDDGAEFVAEDDETLAKVTEVFKALPGLTGEMRQGEVKWITQSPPKLTGEKRMERADRVTRNLFDPEERGAKVFQPSSDLNTVMEQGKEVLPEFQQMHREIAKGLDGIYGYPGMDYEKGTVDEGRIYVGPGPLKGMDRASEKVNNKYKGDASKLGDVVRSSIVVPKEEDFPKAVEFLREVAKKHGWKIRRAENRFAHVEGDPTNVGPLSSGYADIGLQLVAPNGHVAEVQLHLHDMLKRKEGRGHKLYEEQRSLVEKANRTPADEKRIKELNDEMAKLYHLPENG